MLAGYTELEVEAAGIEPASRNVSNKNVYMRILLMLTLQAKPADYRRQVGYHHLWLSLQPVRLLPVFQREGRWRHARHPITALGSESGSTVEGAN